MLPSGTQRKSASRASIDSFGAGQDDAFEDMELQIAIEESYAEPQRPVATTMEAHALRTRRPFFEMNIGQLEEDQAFAHLGLTPDELLLAIRGAFDAGQLGKHGTF